MAQLYEIGSLSDRGRLREHDEDSIITIELSRYFGGRMAQYALLALGDGVGGGPAGQIASRIGVASFCKSFLGRFLDNDANSVTEMIEESFQEAHHNVINASEENPNYSGMATTLTVAFLDGCKCYIGHVGDSRCYLIRKGKIERLTVDQSIGRILQQALGARVPLSVFKDELKLEVNDYVMVCCDGLTNLVDEDTILGIVSRDVDVFTKCQKLVDEANVRGGTDNISVALMKVISEYNH